MRRFGRLLRLSLAPSALADVAAGVVLGAGVWPGGSAPWLLLLGSLCVYHGGMALNDWADRVEDERARPDRPLPSGAIAPRTALALALTLLVGGPVLAWLADPAVGAVVAGVAALAALYDVRGRGPWLGPLLLGLCRAGNLGAGVLLGAGSGAGALALGVPLVYGSYVFVVSRLGRLEDLDPRTVLGRRPARLVALAAALMLVLPIVPIVSVPPDEGLGSLRALLADARIPVSSAIVAAGAFGLLRLAFRPGSWLPPEVVPTMGMALRRLLVVTAAAAVLPGSPSAYLVAGAILCGYPLSYALRKVFPPS